MKEAIVAIIGLAMVVLLTVLVYQNYRRFHKPQLTTTYQAVTLRDGSIFYGRIDHLGTDYPVLRDAFEVQREIGSNTREPRYVLTKRKDHIHGADHMILSGTSIAFVEPVSPDSTVGKLITQATGGK
jgi:hypothetical protein